MLFRSVGQCGNLCVDCRYIYTILAGQSAWIDWVDSIWNFVGDCFVWVVHENKKSKATAKMDGWFICCDGLDAVVHIASDDS